MANQLKLALRHLWRDRTYTALNVFGLSVGLAAALAILLYAAHHYSFDRFHQHSNRIYRVLTVDNALGVSNSVVGITTPGAGPAAVRGIPEVEAQVRYIQQGQNLLRVGDRSFFAEQFALVDSNFFEFFQFPMLAGDAQSVLRSPNRVLLSEELATKLFPGEDPVGKTIEASHSPDPLLVEGVFAKVPERSHIQLDMAVSLIPQPADSGFVQFLESWGTIAAPTYIRIAEQADPVAVLQKLIAIGRENNYGVNNNFSLTLQALSDTHLRSTELLFDQHNVGKTDEGQVRNLVLVAAFLLLIGAFNFMNLSTARSGNRSREIGMRKVLGAQRISLVFQFLLEAILLAALALLVALVLLELFGNQIGIEVHDGFVNYFLQHPFIWFITFLGVLLLGLFSGLYPAMVLSATQPIQSLKGQLSQRKGGLWIRRLLVTLQFTVSIVVIIGMMVVKQQVAFMNEKDMGFSKAQVLSLSINTQSAVEHASTLKEELLKLHSVQSAAFANALPGSGYGRMGLTPEGHTGEDNWIFSITAVGVDFDKVLELRLLEGRFFDQEHPSDLQNGLVLNQAAVEALGWEQAVGKKITIGNTERTVVGVIDNFHYVGLRYPIEPLLVVPLPQDGGTLSIKLADGEQDKALAEVEAVWKRINPTDPMSHSFFDEDFQQLFTEDERFARVLSSFNWLAIVIACVGLLGLTAYTVHQKTPELAVRKVLGAQLPDLLLVLSKEFWLMLLLANALAMPMAWYYMQEWLSAFVFRIELGWTPFALAIAATALVAFFTILTQAFRAYRIETVKALKNE